MSGPEHRPDALREAQRLGHEPDRMSSRLVLGLLLALVVMMVLVHVGVDVFMSRAGRPDVPPRPLSDRARGELAGSDHWAVQPADLEALRRGENQHLEGYAWVDRSAGVVRIPLDRAMELVAAEHEAPR